MLVEKVCEALHLLVIVVGSATISWGFMKLVDYLDGGNKR